MKLSDIATYVKRGITPTYKTEGICVLNQKCIRRNQIDYSFSRRTSAEKHYDEDKYLLPGDILINSTGAGTLGRIAFFSGYTEPVLVDSHVTILRVSSDFPSVVLSYFLFFQEDYIGTLGKGSTNQLELGRDAILRLSIPDIDNELLSKYKDVFTCFNQLIRNCSDQKSILEEMVNKTCLECFGTI